MGKGRKGKKTLFDKVKDLDPSFTDTVYSMSDVELKERLFTMIGHEAEIEKTRDEDPDLTSLREQLKVASQTYSEPLKASKLKKRLILEVLKERGKA